MSYLWHFYSFSDRNFSQVFGTATSNQETTLIDAVRWEYSGFEDSLLAEQLARKALKEGIVYKELSEVEAETLDCIISLAFSPEGLSQDLKVEPESPDGLHPSFIKEMLDSISENTKVELLPILLKGRRIGQINDTSDCNYFVLESGEQEQLLTEVKMILDTKEKWSEDYVPQLINECLLSVIERIMEKEKAMAGFLG